MLLQLYVILTLVASGGALLNWNEFSFQNQDPFFTSYSYKLSNQSITRVTFLPNEICQVANPPLVPSIVVVSLAEALSASCSAVESLTAMSREIFAQTSAILIVYGSSTDLEEAYRLCLYPPFDDLTEPVTIIRAADLDLLDKLIENATHLSSDGPFLTSATPQPSVYQEYYLGRGYFIFSLFWIIIYAVGQLVLWGLSIRQWYTGRKPTCNSKLAILLLTTCVAICRIIYFSLGGANATFFLRCLSEIAITCAIQMFLCFLSLWLHAARSVKSTKPWVLRVGHTVVVLSTLLRLAGMIFALTSYMVGPGALQLRTLNAVLTCLAVVAALVCIVITIHEALAILKNPTLETKNARLLRRFIWMQWVVLAEFIFFIVCLAVAFGSGHDLAGNIAREVLVEICVAFSQTILFLILIVAVTPATTSEGSATTSTSLGKQKESKKQSGEELEIQSK